MRTRTAAAAAVLIALSTAGCDGGTATPVGGSAVPVGEPPTATATGTGPPGGAPADPPASPAPAPSAEAGPVGTRCHTSELRLSFGRPEPAAGQRYGHVVLTNGARRTCTIFGFGGLEPLDAAGGELPITLVPTGPAPTLLRLAPGATVSKQVRFAGIPAGVTCVTPARVELIPPDETDPLTAAWPWGEVCGGRIFGQAYRAGTP